MNMTVLFRKNFGNIEILRVNADPNGISAPIGSLARHSTNGNVYKSAGGGAWSLVSSALSGPSGNTGVFGSIGQMGPQGPQGHQGIVGPQGHQGDMGFSGVQGLAGAQGLAGPQGSQGASAAGGTSAMILLASDYKATAGQNIDFSNLDGDSDRIYVIKQRLMKVNRPSSYSYSFLPNAVSTNLAGQYHVPYYTTSGGASSGISVGSTANSIYHSSSANDVVNITMTIYAEKSAERLILIEYSRQGLAATAVSHFPGAVYLIRWSNTSNNLTSIRLSSSNASGFAVGTETHLYKMVV